MSNTMNILSTNIARDIPISLIERELSGDKSFQQDKDCYNRDEMGTDEQEVDNPDEQNAGDGGWGWLIVISSLIIHFICCGLNRASGILYLRFEEQFDKSASLTAMVTSLSVSLTFFLGPFSTMLCERYSYKLVVMSGGIALATSMIISGLVSDFYILFVSYGLLGGIGKACAYGPGIVMVGTYFKRRRAMAVGIASSGVSIGAFAVPSLVDLSFSEYSYTGAFILMTGLALQLLVCGALLRPYALQKKIDDFNSKKEELTERLPQKIDCDLDSNNKRITKKIRIEKAQKEKERKWIYDFLILKNVRFDCLCGAVLLFHMAFQSAMIFLPSISVSVAMDNFKSFPVVVTGIFDGTGRVLSGFFFDKKRLLPHRGLIYNIALFLMGISLFCIPSASDSIQLGLICAAYGLFYGTGVSQQSVITIDLLGTQSLSSGFGFLLLFQGLGTFVGPPLSGMLRDISGSYDNAFYFGGTSTLIGAIVLLVINVAFHKTSSD